MRNTESRPWRVLIVVASVVAMCIAVAGCAPADDSSTPESSAERRAGGATQHGKASAAGRSSRGRTVAASPAKPVGFTGVFSTMDELQRCKAGPNVVVCASVLSGQKVALGPGGADYKGEVATGFPAPDPLGLGNSITTASGISCENTSRGIECYRGGHGFVIGDSAVVVLRGSTERRFEPSAPVADAEEEPTADPYEPDPYETDPYASQPYDDGSSDCDPNYEGACIPDVPYDLDCDDVGETDFSSIGYDPHGFDGDGDGVACESW